MAADASHPSYDVSGDDGEEKVKIICLGDSAVGKSKYNHILINATLYRSFNSELHYKAYCFHSLKLSVCVHTRYNKSQFEAGRGVRESYKSF